MAVIVNKDEKNDAISRRISADLRERAVAETQDDPDLVEDAEYVQDYKKTGRFAWVWIVLVVLAVISVVIIVTPF